MGKKQEQREKGGAQLASAYEIVQARLATRQADAERAIARMRRHRNRAVRALDDLDQLIKTEAALWALLRLPPREPPSVDWRLRESVAGR